MKGSSKTGCKAASESCTEQTGKKSTKETGIMAALRGKGPNFWKMEKNTKESLNAINLTVRAFIGKTMGLK
jgi:hypothetical protein